MSLVREPTDRVVSPIVFVKAKRLPHRPVTHYTRIRIHSPTDVGTARGANLPISMFDSKRSEMLGHPLIFKPVLLVGKEYLPIIETGFRTISFADAEAARSPAIEDFIVAMLWIDTLGARRIAKKNSAIIDPVRLLRRIIVEGLEARAHRVRLDEFAPGLPAPRGVKPIAKNALAAEDGRSFVEGPEK
jgi:hypothetical protein